MDGAGADVFAGGAGFEGVTAVLTGTGVGAGKEMDGRRSLAQPVTIGSD